MKATLVFIFGPNLMIRPKLNNYIIFTVGKYLTYVSLYAVPCLQYCPAVRNSAHKVTGTNLLVVGTEKLFGNVTLAYVVSQ